MSGGARKGTSIKGQAAARRQGLWSRTELPICRPPLPQLWTPTRWEDLALEEFSFILFIPMLASRAQAGLEHHRLSNAQSGWEGLTGGRGPTRDLAAQD